jgi:hypothetical protein
VGALLFVTAVGTHPNVSALVTGAAGQSPAGEMRADIGDGKDLLPVAWSDLTCERQPALPPCRPGLPWSPSKPGPLNRVLAAIGSGMTDLGDALRLFG